MTDLHSHILFGIDDGSSNIEESIELIKKMKNVGFDSIVLTPHFIEDSKYNANNVIKRNVFEELKKELSNQNIDINLYIGNEVFINDSIKKYIDDDVISTINNTKYVLFELPFYNKIIGLSDIIYNLRHNGYEPILAHPERYYYFKNNYELIDELKEEGLLFQCNYSSIIGEYGNSSKKLIKYLLKKGYVDFFGTDVHHMKRTTSIDSFNKITKKIKKITGEDYYNKIMSNCDKVVKGEEI